MTHPQTPIPPVARAVRQSSVGVREMTLLLLLTLSILLASCTPKANGDESTKGGEDVAADAETSLADEEEADEAVPVEIEEVIQQAIASYISSTANLVAENEVLILGEAQGRVARLLVDEGQYVDRGAVLAELDRSDKEIALAKAKLQQTNSLKAYARGRDLANKELISREEFDRLELARQIADQTFAEAEWQISRSIVRAPFSGRITRRMIQLGQHVSAGTELFQLTDFDPLIAYIYLPEKDVLDLEAGRKVLLSLNADQAVELSGRIRQISPIVDTQTGTVKVTVEATARSTVIRPGSFVTVRVVQTARENVPVVSRGAVLQELQSTHVFVADGGKAVRREVTLGLQEDSRVEIVSGLTAGEQVIVAGQGGLKDGAAIKPLPSRTPPSQEA